MIKIYALFDPRTNTPFYVGSAKRSLKSKLSYHWTTSHDTGWMESTTAMKNKIINDLKRSGNKIEIKLLFICSEDIAPQMEKAAYIHLIAHGYNIYNSINRFHRKN